MATHSSILTWTISWTEKPGGLQSMGLQRLRHNLATKRQYCFTSCKKSMTVIIILKIRETEGKRQHTVLLSSPLFYKSKN